MISQYKSVLVRKLKMYLCVSVFLLNLLLNLFKYVILFTYL